MRIISEYKLVVELPRLSKILDLLQSIDEDRFNLSIVFCKVPNDVDTEPRLCCYVQARDHGTSASRC